LVEYEEQVRYMAGILEAIEPGVRNMIRSPPGSKTWADAIPTTEQVSSAIYDAFHANDGMKKSEENWQ